MHKASFYKNNMSIMPQALKGLFIIIICIGYFSSCKTSKNQMANKSNRTLDIEGHRGCRGLMPENTLPAFMKAMQLGVNTLEMDLIISADDQVIVSHEPYFRAGISQKPDGTPVTEEEQYQLNMYEMRYDEIKTYDVGSLPDPKHPNRANVATVRPLFKDVVANVKGYCDAHNVPLPDFNIEIKRHPKYDNIYHPEAEKFASLVLDQVSTLGISEQTIIQSFDIESLQIVRSKAPDLRLALLIENEDSPEQNVEKLGFTPEIYSSYFQLVDEHLIKYAGEQNMLIIPWTVNEEADIRAMIDIGVDGIISDYPDRVINILKEYAHN